MSIFRAQHGDFTIFAARLTIESIGQRIKKGGLAGTRIACNEIQAIGA